jgi:hypothetical protein
MIHHYLGIKTGQLIVFFFLMATSSAKNGNSYNSHPFLVGMQTGTPIVESGLVFS